MPETGARDPVNEIVGGAAKLVKVGAQVTTTFRRGGGVIRDHFRGNNHFVHVAHDALFLYILQHFVVIKTVIISRRLEPQ
jgi:hypothetical protein